MELQSHWNGCDIFLDQGDITFLEVDAIVNAANSGLRGGGGVDGAIHRRGGPAIMEECRKIIAQIGQLPTGQAVITTGGNLPARYVIHAVGPIYDDDPKAAPQLLAGCYRTSMGLAREKHLRSIAFPCISTGIYGYPALEACPVAVRTVQEELQQHGGFDKVVFCTFLPTDYQIYRETLQKGVRSEEGKNREGAGEK